MKLLFLFILLIILFTACSSLKDDEENPDNFKYKEACLIICEAPYKRTNNEILQELFQDIAYNQVRYNYLPYIDIDGSLKNFSTKNLECPKLEFLQGYKTEYGDWEYGAIVAFGSMFKSIMFNTDGGKIISYEVNLIDEW